MVSVCRVGGRTRVQLEMFVDFHTAARLHAAKDELADKLIIHFQGAEDISVSFRTDYHSITSD